MPVSRDMLVSELKDLVRMTAFEQAVATVRRSQAASPAVEQELAANASASGERLAMLRTAVRSVSGVPDVVGPLVGRAGALVQAQVNQVQTLQGALLGDLTLEHQLRERARYARVLAVSLGESSVLPVLDRLEGAHTETIGWLEARLAEVGRTGTSAIRATPVQAAVGGVRTLAGAPLALAVGGINAVAGVLGRWGRTAPVAAGAAVDSVADAVTSVTGAVGSVAGAAGQVADRVADTTSNVADRVADTAGDVAGRVADTTGNVADTVAQAAAGAADTVGDTAEAAADRVVDTVSDVADRVPAAPPAPAPDEAAVAAEVTRELLEQTGGGDIADAKPPFAGYERLTGDSIMRHVGDTQDVDELRMLLAFEQAHKARKGVLAAAQARLGALAT